MSSNISIDASNIEGDASDVIDTQRETNSLQKSRERAFLPRILGTDASQRCGWWHGYKQLSTTACATPACYGKTTTILAKYLLPLFLLLLPVSAATYEQLLANILNGDIATNNNSSALVDYFSDRPFSCDMDISMASLNNGEVMRDAVTLYEYAVAGEKWGDALFFKHFILYDGQAHVYLESDDLKLDLARLMDGNETLRDIWVESSTNDQLKDLYRSLV